MPRVVFRSSPVPGLRLGLLFVLLMLLAAGSGCSSGDSAGASGSGASGGGADAALCSAPGGPIVGTVNARCVSDGGPVAQATDVASCHVAPTPDAGLPDANTEAGDAGEAGDAEPTASEYGDTLFNAEGDDDQCKYHVSFTSTPICKNADVSLTLTLTNRADGKASLNSTLLSW